jgi:hypothetical protein
MTDTNLFVVPTNHIHQFWHLAKSHLQKAIDEGNGEFTIDQLRQFVSQGQSDLLLIMDKDKQCHCAFTVQWINYPNDRVAYITYLGGRTNPTAWEQFVIWVKNNGGTRIQGSTAKESIVRLWRMKWGMKPKYTLMELEL